MTNTNLDDLISGLNRVSGHMAEEIKEDANCCFGKAVVTAILNFYSDYTPKQYQRTYNFKNIINSAQTVARKNKLIFNVNTDQMDDYATVTADFVFDNSFLHGIHGNSKIFVSQVTPYEYVQRNIKSGFDGEIDNAFDKALKRLLK